jgi:trk system potassium uptake protein TrkH
LSPRLRLTHPPASERISLPPIAVRRRSSNSALVFVYGFAVVILAGAVALMLPFSNTRGEWTPFLDALFTATSAVCVTGLIVVDTGTYWSGIGQAIIAVLMQVGGFGFMTSPTVLLLLIGHRATLRERVLLREALGAGGLGSVLTLARRVGAFMLSAEGIGVVILTARFLTEMDAPRALWWGVFHTVSAFNNAGFDIVGGYRGLTPYSHDPVVLLTIAALFIAGGISYTVVEDLARHRSWVRLTLDTKLVLVCMTGLAVAGTLGLLLTERANSNTLGGMEPGPRVLNAFFQAVSRTAGFSSVDTGR